tara:strand:- start:74 stop:718 length:645 start_codon:yes stop_codon:yes gene_type:complete
MIIAIDGSAGSGKGTLAKNLSTKLNLQHIDTGVLFRIIASQAIDLGIENEDEHLKELSRKLTIEIVEKFRVTEKEKLKSEKISQRSSEIAIKTEVRNELVIFQRKYANYDKSAYNGIILDGRDIGTVVFPNADFKLFLDADIEIRAERRTQELIHLNYKVIYQDILSELRLRDERDINRSVGPLLKAKDAFFIDTGYKSENLVLQEALEFIKIN